MNASGRQPSRKRFELDVVGGSGPRVGVAGRGAAAEFSEHVESEPEEEAAEGFAEPGTHGEVLFFDGGGKMVVGNWAGQLKRVSAGYGPDGKCVSM